MCSVYITNIFVLCLHIHVYMYNKCYKSSGSHECWMPQGAQGALRALRVQWALRALKAQWAAGIQRGIEASMGSKGQGALSAQGSMGWGFKGHRGH